MPQTIVTFVLSRTRVRMDRARVANEYVTHAYACADEIGPAAARPMFTALVEEKMWDEVERGEQSARPVVYRLGCSVRLNQLPQPSLNSASTP